MAGAIVDRDLKPENVIMGDQIIVRANTEEQGGGYSAWVEGIGCAGTGDTEAQAVRSLASVLSDFVKGHKGQIDFMRRSLRELADPELHYDEAPVLGLSKRPPPEGEPKAAD